MRIVVCVKQVVDVNEKIVVDPITCTIKRNLCSNIINPFDLHALEAGLQLRNSGEVIVISMGPPNAAQVLREAIAMGVDSVYLISDEAFAGSDTYTTAYTLSKAIRYLGNFDLILCGSRAIDGETGQVGPQLATLLGIPFATAVRKIKVLDGKLEVESEFEGGYNVFEISLPALLSVGKAMNTPRLPNLKNLLKAKQMQIPIIDAKTLGLDRDEVGFCGSLTLVRNIKEIDFKSPDNQIRLSGTPKKIAQELILHLRKIGIL